MSVSRRTEQCQSKRTHPVQRYIHTLISICLLCNSFTLLEAQWSDMIDRYVEHITVEDGLSSNMIKDVIQDDAGFLWIGTANGLNRYDGKNFSVFKNEPEISNSLSHNHINKLLIDSNGALWVATMQGGLCRYHENGSFDIFKHDKEDKSSICSNQVWTLFEDRQKNLWIGTQSGLSLFDRETETFTNYVNNPKDSSSLANGSIISIIEDHAGRIWLGGWRTGLLLMIPPNTIPGQEDYSFQTISNADNNISGKNVWTLAVDKFNKLWVGLYESGLHHMTLPDCNDYHDCLPEKFDFNKVDFHHMEHEGLALSLMPDDKELYIGYDAGVAKIDVDQLDQYSKIKPPPVTHFNFSNSSELHQSKTIFCNQIYKDQEQLLWLATNKGLYKYFGNKKKFEKQLHEHLTENKLSIQSLFAYSHNSDLWMGTSGKGLLQVNQSTGTIKEIKYSTPDGRKPQTIFTIYGDNNGTIWAGDIDGELYSITYKNKQPTVKYHPIKFLEDHPNNGHIWEIISMEDGHLLIATQVSLILYDPKTGEYTVYEDDGTTNSIEGANIFDIIQYDKDTYYIATGGGGLNRLKWKNGKPEFHFFSPSTEHQNTLRSNILFDLELIGDNLWIGSISGIEKYNISQDSFYHIASLDQRINGKILSMGQDKKGQLWFATDDGLFSYNEKNDLLSRYNEEEGLPSSLNFRSSHSTPDGYIYFGASNCYIKFDGSKLGNNSQNKNSVKITDFKIFNRPVKAGEKDKYLDEAILTQSIINTQQLTLAPQHDVITINYSVFDYISPNQYEYAYWLEGFDNDWNLVGKRTNVTYTNLSSGEYIFKVKARSKSGKWTPVKTLSITVLKPFWQTWWFILGTILTILALIFAFQTYREYEIKQKNIELESLVKEHTQTLHDNIQELKSNKAALETKNTELREMAASNSELEQFAYAVSHDLKQPIRTINSFAGLLKKKLNKKGSIGETENEYIDFIIKGSSNMNQLVNGLLEYSKIGFSKEDEHESFSFEELMLIIKNNLSKQISETNTTLIYPEDVGEIYGMKVKLIQLFQNLISNSIKFRRENTLPIIEIKIEEHPRYSLFHLHDNGVGIPMVARSQVFNIFKRAHSNYEGSGIGLATCKRIIEQHSGEIWVDRECQEGTIFHFYIKKSPAKMSKSRTSIIKDAS